MDDDNLMELAALGALAGGVAEELAVPLARVHETLGLAVTVLDQHFANAKGPDPLPMLTAVDVRERIAHAWLDVGRATRLAKDLAHVVGGKPQIAAIDVNDLVDRAVALSHHRIAAEAEVSVDLGAPPLVSADGARLAGALAHLILTASSSGGSVTIRTRAAAGRAVITVEPGGSDGLFATLVAATVAAAGGSLTRSETVSEVSLPAAV